MITRLFKQLQAEARALLDQVVQLAFFMRGGVQYDDLLLNRTRVEREAMEAFIQDNLKRQKGSPHLVF